jgi:hypothetical protein
MGFNMLKLGYKSIYSVSVSACGESEQRYRALANSKGPIPEEITF